MYFRPDLVKSLKKELERVDELEFIFTSPSFVAEDVTDKVRKERRQFFIPAGHAESAIAGSEFEIRLRNKLTQKAIARECADWVRRKVTFRSNATGSPMQRASSAAMPKDSSLAGDTYTCERR